MATNYTGNATPTLNNAPANSWTTDAEKRSHVGNTYLVTGSGGTAGNVYAFEKYPSAVVKEVPASGLPAEIVTITDGGENLPMTSAEVSLSPIQSLNGYDSPWPGGGGKNKASDVQYFDAMSRYARVINASYTLKAGKRYVLSWYTQNTGIQIYRQSPTTLGFDSLSTYGFVCDGTRKSMYGTAAADATIENKNVISRSTEDSTTGTGLCYDFQIEEVDDTVTQPTSYAPYSNICPITGHTGAELYVAAEYDAEDKTTYSVTFTDQGTVYGGTFDFVSGKLTVTMANIASYNGETLPGEWLSSMDAYAAGTTPTTGAQVVYELATPLEYTLSAQQLTTLLGENNVWSDAGEISKLVYRSNQYVMAYDWFETWTMPKITRNNGNIIVLPYPQEYTPEIYDVDASTTGRNAAGTMVRDRVARKHKFNYKFPPLGQADATEILNAVQDSSFTLTTASPETGAKTNYRVYVGDRSLPVYWMPNHNQNSWLYETLTLNLIEM